jgi:serine/threonine-protein kinase
VGNLMSLAQCEEHTARLAAARAHLQQAVGLARGLVDRRETEIQALLTALDPRVPRLTLRRALGAPAALKVKRDDIDLDVALFDVALPVEPGTHVLVASAEGFEAKRVTVELAEGQSRELVVQTGARVAPVIAPEVVAPAPVPPAPPPQRPSIVVPVALGVAGGVSLVVGTVFGVVALETNHQAVELCPSHMNCPGAALSKSSTSNSEAWVANVTVPVGVVMVAGAAIWWVINGRATPARATLGWQELTVTW